MIKNERGSVTGITVATILFIMIIMGTYLTSISSKRKAQLQETKLLQEIYGGDINKIYEEQLEKNYVRILPQGYTEVSYIQATGTQYIDTEYKANQDTSVKMSIEFTSISGYQNIFCSRSSNSSKTYTLFVINDNFRYDYASKQNNITGGLVLNQKYEIYAQKNTLKLNNNALQTVTKTDFNSDYNMYFFASYEQYNSIKNYAKCKLYSAKIYDGDTLVRDFIPCYRNSDNTVGLYDIVGKKFYESKGTEKFVI